MRGTLSCCWMFRFLWRRPLANFANEAPGFTACVDDTNVKQNSFCGWTSSLGSLLALTPTLGKGLEITVVWDPC